MKYRRAVIGFLVVGACAAFAACTKHEVEAATASSSAESSSDPGDCVQRARGLVAFASGVPWSDGGEVTLKVAPPRGAKLSEDELRVQAVVSADGSFEVSMPPDAVPRGSMVSALLVCGDDVVFRGPVMASEELVLVVDPLVLFSGRITKGGNEWPGAHFRIELPERFNWGSLEGFTDAEGRFGFARRLFAPEFLPESVRLTIADAGLRYATNVSTRSLLAAEGADILCNLSVVEFVFEGGGDDGVLEDCWLTVAGDGLGPDGFVSTEVQDVAGAQVVVPRVGSGVACLSGSRIAPQLYSFSLDEERVRVVLRPEQRGAVEAARITGRVFDADGSCLPDSKVSVFVHSDDFGEVGVRSSVSTFTDAEGRFEILVPKSVSRYRVFVSNAVHGLARVAIVDARSGNIDFKYDADVLRKNGALVVRARPSDYLIGFSRSGPIELVIRNAQSGATEWRRVARLPAPVSVGPGRYFVEVAMPGGGLVARSPAPVEVVSGAASTVEVAFEPAGDARGSVVELGEAGRRSFAVECGGTPWSVGLIGPGIDGGFAVTYPASAGPVRVTWTDESQVLKAVELHEGDGNVVGGR